MSCGVRYRQLAALGRGVGCEVWLVEAGPARSPYLSRGLGAIGCLLSEMTDYGLQNLPAWASGDYVYNLGVQKKPS